MEQILKMLDQEKQSDYLVMLKENRFDLLKINKIDKSYEIKTWNLKQKTAQLELKEKYLFNNTKKEKKTN